MIPVITTNRLVLRPFELSDVAFVHALLNDPDWIRFIGDRGIRSLADAERAIKEKYQAAYQRDGFGLMVVERREDGCAMGMCGLIRRPGLDDVDIGFAFLPAYRNSGYAIEAARAVLDDGRTTHRLGKVVAITMPANASSISLIERLGMRFEKNLILPNDPELLALYSIDLAPTAGE